MPQEVILKEKYGVNGREILYIRPPEQNVVVQVGSDLTFPVTFCDGFKGFLKQVFLPQGYPDSVSDDYKYYQIWDTVQAFCSSITGVLTTKAVMTGVGVGNETATPLAAAVTWVVKNGMGMVGGIVFAWWKGTRLDSECKKWRLFADAVNDFAMLIEIMLLYFTGISTILLCFSTVMKAIVGVAGGATRAAVMQHQAIKNNTADVAAKDGSQETCVNLLASMIGLLILSSINDGGNVLHIFILFSLIHLFANYKAVSCLKISTFNVERLNLALEAYLSKDEVPTIDEVNRNESVILGSGYSDKKLCGFSICLGVSIKNLIKSGHFLLAEDMKLLRNIYQSHPYVIIVDLKEKHVNVVMLHTDKAMDVIQAYFHAVLLGIATSELIEEKLAVNKMMLPKISNPLIRIHELIQKYKNPKQPNKILRLPLEAMLAVEEFMKNDEFQKFINKAQKYDWNFDHHHLFVDEYRINWQLEH